MAELEQSPDGLAGDDHSSSLSSGGPDPPITRALVASSRTAARKARARARHCGRALRRNASSRTWSDTLSSGHSQRRSETSLPAPHCTR